MVKRFMPVMLAVVMLLSVFSSGLGTYKVQAASDSISYDCIEYGDKSKDNWGYLLVPKGVSGPLQAGIVIHGLSGETNAAGHVTNALKKWGNKISPKIIVLPIITRVPGDIYGTDTVYKFRNYVYDKNKEKSPIQDVIAQMDDGTFNKLIANKGYGCSIDNNKSYFVTGWSLGGASAALAGIQYRDIFPYVGVLSPAPTMNSLFTFGYLKSYSFSDAPERIRMMSAAVREDAEEGCYSQMRIAATQLDTSKKFTYFAFDYAEHSAGLFMTELYIFLYAVDHNETYPSNEEIKAMYPTQVWRGKTYDTCILDFPDESDQSPNHRWMANGTCSACAAVKKTKDKDKDLPVIQSVNPSVKNNTVKMGEYYSMTVNASGSGLSYQWMWRTDKSDWDKSKCPGSNDATIQLEGKRPVVYYKCVVSNAAGSVETAEIPVYLAKPVLTSSVGNTVKKGQKYTISSDVKYDKRFIYKWEYDKDDNKGWRESQLDGCTQKDTLDLEGKNPVITYKLTIIYKDGNNTFSVTSDGVKITMAE